MLVRAEEGQSAPRRNQRHGTKEKAPRTWALALSSACAGGVGTPGPLSPHGHFFLQRENSPALVSSSELQRVDNKSDCSASALTLPNQRSSLDVHTWRQCNSVALLRQTSIWQQNRLHPGGGGVPSGSYRKTYPELVRANPRGQASQVIVVG